MNPESMKKRTKEFALRAIKLVSTLPENPVTRVIGNQLLRSATSVGANYRAVCKARSKPDFISKMGIVQEEADESAYWMEILTESDIVKKECVDSLLKEANEIVAVTVASIITAKNNRSS